MAAGGSPEVSPEEEKWIIIDLSAASEAQAKAGDTFFLITRRWWQEWVLYVGQDQDGDGSPSDQHDSVRLNNIKRPSRIDNSDLISGAASEDSTTGVQLRDTLVEGTDYILLPQEVWDQLYAWYGGGPTLARKVISSGQSELSVEVYPLRLHLHLMPKNEDSTIRISKRETVGALHQRAREIFYLTSEQVSIWDYYGKRKHALMNDMRKTLEDANIQMDQDILVEVAGSIQENGRADKETTSVVVRPPKSSFSLGGGLSTSKVLSRNSNSASSQFQSSISHGRESDSAYGSSGVTTRGSSGGLTGLANLGNTCFMNSAIQCLVHTPEFARYFRDDYHKEINRQNPLGMVGELALAFGELLRKLWAPGRNPVAPRPFKAKLAKFAPQFSGYNQHDSQELLAFLLDGLHEDLNRVKHRPNIKSRDADGRSDEEVADEYWANHVARNDSIIVDVCQGQYKSTLVCPVCSRVSVTFDPFMYLSLPLQSTTSRTMTVTVFTCDGSTLPNTCTVTVPKQGRCRDLTQAISYACSLKHNEKLLLAEVRNHQIRRFLEDPLLLLSSIKDDEHLAAYKIPKFTKNVKYLQLIHRREQQATGSSHRTGGWKPFGTPLVLPILCDENVTRGDIQSRVHSMLSPMLRTRNVGHPDSSDSYMSLPVLNQSQTTSSIEACAKSSATGSLHKDGGNSKSASLKKLPLKLVDENNVFIDITVGEDKAIKLSTPSISIKVLIDWSDKLFDSYDTHYLENLPEVFKYGSAMKKGRTEPITLYTCLEAFLREEPLVTEDMWNCPQCKEQRQASKKLDLWRLPEVLVIHLKRFSYSRSVKHKLETFVNFPIHNLDLTNYVANKKNPRRELYELYALTNHYGGMGSGHYTAHIKLVDENRWYNFDDSHVAPISEDDVKSAAAYVLFYKRVKVDDASVSNGVLSSTGRNVSSPR